MARRNVAAKKVTESPVAHESEDLWTRLRVTVAQRRSEYLARRPHRSFKRTYSRDYRRSLDLPGYWSFTAHVVGIIRANRILFLGLIALYSLLGAVLVGLSSQDTYSQLSQLLDDTGSELFTAGWGSVGQAGLLLLTGLSGGLSPQLTDAQQIYSALILLLTWLTTVWLLRGIMAGKRPRLRDGLYNAGSPIVATAMVLLVMLVQLLPATIGVIIASSAASTNLYESGFMAMLISIVVSLLIVLSAYWAVATFFALIIVTLPGMYPWQALKTAGDLVIGRRVRLLLRLAWMGLLGMIGWAIVVLAMILIVRLATASLPWIASLPVVPIIMAFMSAIVVVWCAAYVYLLYRKVVEDDARPA